MTSMIEDAQFLQRKLNNVQKIYMEIADVNQAAQ